MPVGKTKRFATFARDGFACRYCGQRPPDVILELDHIHPRAEGGTDDELNLITSCFDCNRGKRDKIISEVAPRPDADLEYLKLQQEIAEIRRYQEAKLVRDEAFSSLTETLNATWTESLTSEVMPADRQWRAWLNKYTPAQIETAIHKAVPMFLSGKLSRNKDWEFTNSARYVSGILKSIAAEEETATLVSEEQALDWIMNAEAPPIKVADAVLSALTVCLKSQAVPKWFLWATQELQDAADEQAKLYDEDPLLWEMEARKDKSKGVTGGDN